MYYFGLGCARELSAAYECLTLSGERGNVYSLALLCDYYYRNKLYIKAADLSKKYVLQMNQRLRSAASTVARVICLLTYGLLIA